jgi:CHAT domain-containing protein
LQSPPEIAATFLSLGNTARITADYQSAIAFYQQAIAKTPSSLTKVQAQINLLTVLLNTQQWKIAQPLLKQIPTELNNLPLSQVAVYARIHLAQSLMKDKQSVNESKEFAAKMLDKTTKLAQIAEENLQVLAGGLVQPSSQFRQFPPLPEIQSEFNLIAKAGIATTKLLDRDFISQALAAKISSIPFNVVHLATHGQFSSRPKDTFILATDRPINVIEFDLLLRRRDEIYSQPLELLVLSACQTAEGVQ